MCKEEVFGWGAQSLICCADRSCSDNTVKNKEETWPGIPSGCSQVLSGSDVAIRIARLASGISYQMCLNSNKEGIVHYL